MNSYSLTELMTAVRDAVGECFPDLYWVRAEISSLSCRQGGHCYLELTDAGAKVRANCWANIWAPLSAYFRAETGTDPAIGQQVLLRVAVDVHPQYGLSLSVRDIDPSFTLGEAARRRQQTIAALAEQGMLELQKALPLPTIIRRIAVISSPDAAGYQDFVHQLTAGEPSPYRVELYAATMQGEQAPKSIIHALEQVAEGDYDIVVIIRGGGATTDLSCFDDRDLAEHCAQFPLPILSGIGHTRDVSIVDMVAYEAVKTPTAAAEWLRERRERQLLRLDDLQRRLGLTASRQIMLRRQRLDMLEQHLRLLSPERIYQSGYSLTTVGGRPLRTVQDAPAGTRLTIHLPDGSLRAVVENE